MQDCQVGQNNGQYRETEIEDDFEEFDSGVNLFFFFDNCRSGGIIDSLDDMSNENDIYVAATCSYQGNGYPCEEKENGYWTLYFLEFTWIGNNSGLLTHSMEYLFGEALEDYPYGGNDEPEYYDGDLGSSFYL
jgi:hypothetical protein